MHDVPAVGIPLVPARQRGGGTSVLVCRSALAAALLVWAAQAQTVVSGDDIARAKQVLAQKAGEQPLRCSVDAIKPKLNFGLRFQTGYTVEIPLVQYSGSGHVWKIVSGVTPGGGQAPVYLADRIDLPPVLRPEFNATTRGTFVLGEGSYRVQLAVSDDENRVCRSEWQAEARLNRSERKLKPMIPPGTVGDSSFSMARGASEADLRVTLLVNASPPYVPRYIPDPPSSPAVPVTAYSIRREFAENDYRMELIGMLAPLLEALPGASVRLVVFDLDNRNEILRRDGFSFKDIKAVERALYNPELWKVDVGALRNQRERWAFLEDLLERESRQTERSDMIVFLGSRNGNAEGAPPHLSATTGPALFYLQYNPYRDQAYTGIQPDLAARPEAPGHLPELPQLRRPLVGSPLSDTIDVCVRRLKGRTLRVFSPADFGKAVEAIRK